MLLRPKEGMYYMLNPNSLELFMGGLPARPDLSGSENGQAWTAFFKKNLSLGG